MMFNPQTAAMLTALVVSIVGIFKFLVPEGPRQNDFVRLMSALVGTLVFLGDALTTHPVLLSICLPAAAEGFVAGAGATVAVKGYHMMTAPSVEPVQPGQPVQPLRVEVPTVFTPSTTPAVSTPTTLTPPSSFSTPPSGFPSNI